MHQFNCIGAECEKTCCAGWAVNLDKISYKKYRNLRDRKMYSIINSCIVRNKDTENPEEYGLIQLKNNACPLWMEDGKCFIQKNLGENYLSHICSSYPRTVNQFDNHYEMSLDLSCPEAARLVLFNDKMMSFEVNEKEAPTFLTGTDSSRIGNAELFWNIRNITIDILQNRTFKIGERLILLGLFIQENQEAKTERKTPRERIQKNNSYIQAVLTEPDLRKELTSLKANLSMQLLLIRDLMGNPATIKDDGYRECLEEFIQGINSTGENSFEELIQSYQSAYQAVYQPFIESREYIWENYLVNYVFSHLFPSTPEYFNEFALLALHYGILKTLCIGVGAYHHQLNEALIVKIMTGFTRTIDHDKHYMVKVLELMEKHGLLNMAHMSILIKN